MNSNKIFITYIRHMVLARKYRPQSLSEIVGQDILVQTIRNAISLNRLPQAILLTGTRGIGKTTTARIIAKYLNCSNISTGDCCNTCESCIAIANCCHPDVLEFDAASNTSVNDIRTIIDSIPYMPIKSSNKFYIIDEVHMLSNSAFNALLKTLEEPPIHVRFILATTEECKIPLTIISRCLQFRLQPIKYQTITRNCNSILNKEGYTAEDSVMEMIAQAANGSMRDALSLLDGAIVFCADSNKKLLLNKVIEMLGHKHHERLETAFKLLCEGDVNQCLDIICELYDYGIDPIVLANDMLQLVYNTTKERVLSKNVIEMPFLLRTWHILSETINGMKESDNQMMQFEMSLIKLAYLNTIDTPESIITYIKDGSHNETLNHDKIVPEVKKKS